MVIIIIRPALGRRSLGQAQVQESEAVRRSSDASNMEYSGKKYRVVLFIIITIILNRNAKDIVKH